MSPSRLPGAVSLSFRSLQSPFHSHGLARWDRSPSSQLSCPPPRPRLHNSFSQLPRYSVQRLDMATSLQRSLSISSASSSKTETRAEASDLLSELRQRPSTSTSGHLESTITAAPPPPPSLWMQELMQSNSTRHSRASSIVSTRTRFSTSTLDDPRADCRSIDIHVGGQHFRISRDGSKITEDLPPPYTGPPPPSSFRLSSPDRLLSRPQEDDDGDGGHRIAGHASSLDPTEVELSSRVDGDVLGPEVNSQGTGTYGSTPVPPHRRSNTVRLPSLVTDSLDGRIAGLSSGGQWRQARGASTSAGPVSMSTSDMAVPDSPTFIGRDASALFLGMMPASTPEAGLELGDEETNPPAMATDNDISHHYTGLVRRLDREHRKALHEKDKELEQLRVRLHEVDTVYRQELRARDFMIDDLKKRLDHLQETQERRIEEARHEVEDLWESRWKQRDFHLRERMRRLEEVVHTKMAS